MNQVLDITRPETAAAAGADLAEAAGQLVQRFPAVMIADVSTLGNAVIVRRDIGAAVARVEAFFKPLKSLAHQMHRTLCDRESAILAPLLETDRQWKNAISDFTREQDRIRKEAERVEQERQQQQRDADAAAEAAALERSGDAIGAAAVIEDAIAAPAPVVVLPSITADVPDLKFRRRWLHRITDDTKIPREFLAVDEKKIAAYARTMKQSAKILGVDFYYVDDPIR